MIGVTWTLSPVVENFDRREVKVTGVRTSIAPAPERVDTYTVDGHLDSGPNKVKIMDRLRARHHAKVLRESELATVFNDLVASGEAAMNQWEIDNG